MLINTKSSRRILSMWNVILDDHVHVTDVAYVTLSSVFLSRRSFSGCINQAHTTYKASHPTWQVRLRTAVTCHMHVHETMNGI